MHSLPSYEFLRYIDCENADESPERTCGLPTRGVGWVLGWAGAIAVLTIAVGVLTEFGYLLAAEHSLARAARAAALEAALPRATNESVSNIAQRRLSALPALASAVNMSLLLNGAPVGRTIRPRPGDHITVAIAAPTSAALPDWLQVLRRGRGDVLIMVRAEREMPCNRIPASAARRQLFAR